MESLSRFCHALVSEHPTIPEEAQLFAPLIGSWDLVVRWFDKQGVVSREENGEWHFAWVLEGRAVQDVWIVPPRGARGHGRDYEYGTSVRFYDDDLKAWRSTWIGPAHRSVLTFMASADAARIVMETTPAVPVRLRWSFHDLTDAGFTWTNEVWEDGHWRTQQTFFATRSNV